MCGCMCVCVCVCVYVCVYMCMCESMGVGVFVWSLAGGIDTAEDAYSSGTPGLTTDDSAQQPAGWMKPSIQ